ncbi:MAG: hypothetical protein QNJ64_19100 [Crocosphaera sp.]|nr:hypothetical protein [Crocosphaera sp.]
MLSELSDRQLAKLKECFTKKIVSTNKPIVGSENKVKFELINDYKESITVIKVDIDKCLFKKLREVKFIQGNEPKKCDYLVIIPDKLVEIWIELKSSEVETAKKQLEQILKNKEFYNLLNQILDKYYLKNNNSKKSIKQIPCVVYGRNRSPSKSTRRQKQKKQAKVKAKSSEQKINILEYRSNQKVKISELIG